MPRRAGAALYNASVRRRHAPFTPESDRKGERDARYGLHPSDFDSCFHALLTLFGVHGDRPDVTYLPMRFGSLRLLKPGAAIAGAEIVVRRLSPRSIDATFTILGADGEIVAVLADARFRAVTLSRRTPLERLSYHYAPALVGASEEASAPAPTGDELAARAAALGLTATGDVERPEDDLLLEAFAVAAAHESLSAIFGRKRQGAIADLIKRGRLAAASAPLAYSLLGLLEHQGHATVQGDVWTLVAKTGLPPSAEIIRTIIADFPDRGAECVLATRAAVLLPKALKDGPLASPYGASTLAHAGS
ncbi:polyketide synthase dehydratase domain-containing protein, partial [Hansschlegelia beijingensis]